MHRPRKQGAATKSGGTLQDWSGLELLEGRLLLSAAGITPITDPAVRAADAALIVLSRAAAGGHAGQTDVMDVLASGTTAPSVTFAPGQLPATLDANVTLTGTYDGVGISGISRVTVTLDDGQGDLFDFDAALDTDSKTWTALVDITGLAGGAYAVTVTAVDDAAAYTTVDVGNVVLKGPDGGESPFASADSACVCAVASQVADTQNNSPMAQDQSSTGASAPTVMFAPAQLPATLDANVTLTGTYDGVGISGISRVTVTLDDGQGNLFDFDAALDTDSKTWTAPVDISGLAGGAYDLSVTVLTQTATYAFVRAGKVTIRQS